MAAPLWYPDDDRLEVFRVRDLIVGDDVGGGNAVGIWPLARSEFAGRSTD